MQSEFQHPLDPLFNPRSIAVFGASDTPGHIGEHIFSNLLASGFGGQVFAINPKHEIVQDKPCHADLTQVDASVDLALICTPNRHLKTVLTQCEKHRVLHAIHFPHPSDNARDATVDRIVNGSAVRILGPNSVGLCRPWLGLNADFVAGHPPKGTLAVVSQSASLCSAISDWATPHHLGLSALVSLGDGTNVKLGDAIEFFADDPRSEAILVYVDRVSDGAAFVSALRYATWRKPVVVLKPRTTTDEDDLIFDAVLCRTGAVRAHSIGELFAAAEILSAGRRTNGDRLLVASNSHAAKCLAQDRARALGIAPHDGANERYDTADCAHIFERMLKDTTADGLLALFVPKPGLDANQIARDLIAAAATDTAKPVLACWMGDSSVSDARHALSAAGIPDFATPESAVDAFHILLEHKKQADLALEMPGPRTFPDSKEADARKTVATALAQGRDRLNPNEVEQIFSTARIPLTEKGNVHDQDAICLRLRVGHNRVFGRFIEISHGSERPRNGVGIAIPPLTSVLANRLVSRSNVETYLRDDSPDTSHMRENLVKILLQISDLVCALPEVTCLRAHVILNRPSDVGLSHAEITIAKPDPDQPVLSVAPYPEHLVTRDTMPDGTEVEIRPIRAEDARQEDDFVAQLSPRSKRLRFFGAIQTLSPRQLARFTQLDFRRELALVAVLQKGSHQQQIAVARYYILPNGTDAEFAVVVHDEYQRMGLATKLMLRLRDAAKAQKIARLRGSVLKENIPMLNLTRSLGCKDYIDPNEPDVVQVVLDLT